jgi:hypothetical protein
VTKVPTHPDCSLNTILNSYCNYPFRPDPNFCTHPPVTIIAVTRTERGGHTSDTKVFLSTNGNKTVF